MTHFAKAVRAELKRARTKHPKPIHSQHEGFAVLLEEVDEVKKEVFHGDKDRAIQNQNLWMELVQVAAMAQRTAEDCGL